MTAGASSGLGDGTSEFSPPSCSDGGGFVDDERLCSSMKLSVMDDTDRDKLELESGVADGRDRDIEREDGFDVPSLGISPVHFCMLMKLAGSMFSRPDTVRLLAFGRSRSLALDAGAMAGGG